MAQEINYKNLITLLVDETKAGVCEWVKVGPECFRLLLKNGSVKLSSRYDSFLGTQMYKIEFYDMKTSIFHMDTLLSSDDESQMVVALYDAIIDRENSIVNKKLSMLEDDLCNLT